MSARWSLEPIEQGTRVVVRRAPLWKRVAGTVLPSVIIAAAVFVLALHADTPGAYAYMTILLIGAAVREALRWQRSADTVDLLDDGVVLRKLGARPGREPPSLPVEDDTTVRVTGGRADWALQGLLDLAPTPRVAIRTAGRQISFGVGLPRDEAERLVEQVLSAPAFRRVHRAPPAGPAAVRRVQGAIGGRAAGHAAAPGTERDAMAPQRRSPLTSSAGAVDIGVLVASLVVVGLAWWTSHMGPATNGALAVLGLAATIPSLLRFSRTAFSGSTEARVLERPARPGETVTVRFSLDRHAPAFEWIDLRLQYVRQERESGWAAQRRMTTHVLWEGLHRLSADRYPPGPDEHVDANFALPEDAPSSPPSKRLGEHWRLDVRGRTTHGDFAEWFPVVVLPPGG